MKLPWTRARDLATEAIAAGLTETTCPHGLVTGDYVTSGGGDLEFCTCCGNIMFVRDRGTCSRCANTCTGTTIKGKPCTLEPEPGTDRCIFHPRAHA